MVQRNNDAALRQALATFAAENRHPHMAKKQPAPAKNISPARPKTVASATQKSSNWLNLWPFFVVALLVTTVCYWPALSHDLVNWDDAPNIYENPNLARVGKGEPWSATFDNIFDLEKGNVIGNYNPLPIFTFALEKAAAGGEFGPKMYQLIHRNNLLLHLGVVFFAMRVLLLLGLGRWGALVGGLLMGIHPMRVESVAWATERKDVLFAFFFFASLECYIRYLKTANSGRKTLFFVGSMLLAGLSLLSKVQAVTLVGSMVLVDYLLRRPLDGRAVADKLLLVAASAAIGMANLHTLRVQGSTNDDVTGFGLAERLGIGSWSFCVYVYKLFIPYPMSPVYPYPKPVPVYVYAAPLLFFAALGGLVWLFLKGHRRAVFAIGFFLCNVVLLLQFFGAGQGYLADRFTYVPYFGFFCGAAWVFEHFFEKEKYRTACYATLGLLTVVYAAWTLRQVGIWKDGETLWTHAMKFEFDAKTGRYQSALPFWNRGQHRRTIAQKTKNLKLYESALADYTQGISVNPKDGNLYNSRGKTYFDLAMGGLVTDQAKRSEYLAKSLGDYDQAVKLAQKTSGRDISEVYVNRGSAKGASGQLTAALADLNKGAELDPNNKNAYFNRSIVYYQLNKPNEAIADYTKYLTYEPNDQNILYERGMLRRGMNQATEAMADLTRAIQIKPDFGLAYRERGRVYLMLGNNESARADFQKAQQYGAAPMQQDLDLLNR
jgi:protein O-mannosyl-transferase